MKLERRYADMEYRESDEGVGIVSGTIIRYGDVADIGGWFTEEFRSGWVSNWDDLMIANRMHNRDQPLAASDMGLTIVDNEERMTAEVTLPDTSAGRDVQVEVAQKLLRGLSLEFRAIKDEYDWEKDHRVIIEGRMYGFGIVDRPAYADSSVDRASEYRDHFGLRWGEMAAASPESMPSAGYGFKSDSALRYHIIGG